MCEKVVWQLDEIRKLLMELDFSGARKAAYKKIAEGVKSIFEADGSALYTYDARENLLTLEEGPGLNQEVVGVKVDAREGMLGLVLESKRAMKVDDYANWPGRSKIFETQGYRALLEAPISSSDKIWGIIGLVRLGNYKVFTDLEMALLSLFGTQIGSLLCSFQKSA
jgi:signal transduction protein with GAF and PtsI domain